MKPMLKILLFGKDGQVGWELQRSLSVLGEVTALDRHDPNHCGDLGDLAGIANTVRALRPDVVVNAAAYTAVDKAESEPDLAQTINAAAPGVLAVEAAKIDAWLIHYSTDYVFDGSGDRPWHETDQTAPLSVYGETKLAGERRIQQSGCQHLILRTSWVYAARGKNFAKTMLQLAQQRDELQVVNDQWGAPTGADLLADVTAHAIRRVQAHPEDGGLYHCTAAGETNWHAYAEYVLRCAKKIAPAITIQAISIKPVPTSAFPTPARRPRNSRLDTHKLQSAFDLVLPDWREGVARMLTETLQTQTQ